MSKVGTEMLLFPLLQPPLCACSVLYIILWRLVLLGAYKHFVLFLYSKNVWDHLQFSVHFDADPSDFYLFIYFGRCNTISLAWQRDAIMEGQSPPLLPSLNKSTLILCLFIPTMAIFFPSNASALFRSAVHFICISFLLPIWVLQLIFGS